MRTIPECGFMPLPVIVADSIVQMIGIGVCFGKDN